MRSPRIRWALIALILCAALASKTPAFAESPAIMGFTGETIPGIMTQMELHWAYVGDTPPDLRFHIYTIPKPADTLLVSDLPGSERKVVVAGDPAVLAMQFMIYAVSGGARIAEATTLAPVAHQGVIGGLTGADMPHDGGGRVGLSWSLPSTGAPFKEFRIYRMPTSGGQWRQVGIVEGNVTAYTDAGLKDGERNHYMVRGYRDGEIFETSPVMNLFSEASWFDWQKINLLIIALVVLSAVVYYVLMSGRRPPMYIRKIAGLQAVEEAVGRATEMGRSVLFIPGIQDLDDVQTIAGLTILGSVAKMTAQYETRLDVPVSRSLVMSNGREVVKQAYTSVGRPDFYNDDIVHYVTDEQFGYVAAIDGIMVREKPATCFFMGAFFAESLILAETGNHVGAIQIAGTAMPTQLPFFVAACDYTLIGEELFAASAYLSKDAGAIASLRGQDVGKALAMGSIVVGTVLVTLAGFSGNTGFIGKLSDAFVRLFALNF